MAVTYLVDKSVLGHLHHPDVRAPFRELLESGGLAVSTVTLLEQRVSDRSPDDSRRFDRLVLSRVELVSTEATDVDRARELQALLLTRSQHRGPSIPDLLVAAVAERRGMTVLHLDRDFEIIATTTGQAERRIAELPAGPAAPARPPRGTGVILRRQGGARHTPHVVCAGCRRSIRNVVDGIVHYHVSSTHAAEMLDGRLAFTHVACSHMAPAADYRELQPMSDWLAALCRELSIPEITRGVFEVASPAG